jgi:hypothetical protein
VGAAGGGAAGAARGRAGAGAEAAMHPAAAVPHRRLPAAAAGTGLGAAAGRSQEVTGRGAIPEPAAAVRREGGSGGVGASSHVSLSDFQQWNGPLVRRMFWYYPWNHGVVNMFLTLSRRE